jgi:histidine ammonia-lyase
MTLKSSLRGASLAVILAVTAAVPFAAPAMAQTAMAHPAYHAITPTMAGQTITLTGHDLTIDQVIQVARYGAKVQTTAEAKQHMQEAYGLLLEGSTEGIAIYWFNRGAGGARETVIFAGDPESPQNRPIVSQMQMRAFQGGASGGYGPEVADEEIVRAMMVIRANAMIHNAPSPGLAQMLVDLINHRITPVVQSRGTVGEGDLGPLMNVGGAMVGAGEVYLNGVRMSAADALAKEGLKPIVPFAADNNALSSSNGYATAQAALLVYDGKKLLDWTDLAYAMDLNGMNSNVSPLTIAVQSDRPDKWLNWDAGRILDMIKGSYLFDNDQKRIIQDPESMRASSIRQASAWKAWATLKDSVTFQINTSDHNPVVKVGLKPTDSWEMATPQMMRYYVKGGPRSNNKGGYILSNANWDPYPMSNEVESFTLSLANLGVAVVNRMQRFSDPFFTVIKETDVIPGLGYGGGGYTPVDLWQEIQTLANPVTPEGNSMGDGVEELQAQTRLKTARARQTVDVMFHLVGFDLTNAARWMDVRMAQDPKRGLGAGPTAALTAFRKVVPLKPTAIVDGGGGAGVKVYDFMKANPATSFYPAGPAFPVGEPVAAVKW